MEESVADRDVGRGPSRRNVLVVIGVAVVVVGALVAFVVLSNDDSDDAAPAPTTTADVNVSDSDAVVIDLPQSASLRLFVEDDTWYVENDGNVTMSDVEVRDGSDAVLCELGTLAPDDRAECADAEGGDGLRAVGSSPQGEQVEAEAG